MCACLWGGGGRGGGPGGGGTVSGCPLFLEWEKDETLFVRTRGVVKKASFEDFGVGKFLLRGGCFEKVVGVLSPS